jgi:hypothetical protein
LIEPTDSEQKERSVAVTLGEVLAGLHGMAEIPGMPDLAEMPPDGFTFQIPPCQRPYRWKLSDIEHVLADVADMRSAESTTLWYFGPICFRRDKDVMQIYDGQQRLTSMLLVVSVLAERLQADGANLGLSEEQAERLRSAAEGAARFSYDRPATVDAIMLMTERLRNRFGLNRKAGAGQLDVRADAQRVVWMLDHVFFSATVLRSDIEAAQYFQGENNRGASMQLVDLVKSLNLRFVPEADLEKYAALWTNLAEQRTRGTFQGSDAVERVLLPSMLIVRGLWTFEAEANDADDYRHFISGRGDFARKRISDSRAGTQGEATFPTLSSMPRTGVPFFRTLVWSAVLLAAVRRTLDTEADDYQQYITGQELEPLLCNGLVYWADAFMTDADGSMPNRFEAFMASALEDPSQVNPDLLAEADIVKECAARLARDPAYEGWREALLLVMETLRLLWERLDWRRIVRALALERTGECLLLVPYACGRAEETVAELFRRVRYRPSSMTGPNGHNGDNEESKKEKKNHAHQVSKASKMVVFDLYEACGSRSESIAAVFNS